MSTNASSMSTNANSEVHICPFFTNTKNRIATFTKSASTVSKILKLAQAIFAAFGELAVSEYVREGCNNTVCAIRDTRLVMSLFKIFGDIIPKAVNDGAKFWSIGKQILYHTYKGSVKTPLLKFGFHATGLISKLGVIFGFGVCRSITFLEKQWEDLGKHAHSIGKAFPIVITVTLAASVASKFFAFAGGDDKIDLDYITCGDNFDTHEEHLKALRDYPAKMQSVWLGLFESAAELSLVSINVAAVATPFYVRIPLALVSGLCGLYSVWVTV